MILRLVRNLALGILLLITASSAQHKVVGYFPDWWDWFGAEQVDYSRLTHVAWSFVAPTSNDLQAFPSAKRAKLDSLVLAAHTAQVKVILSLGGAESGATFRTMTASSSVRHQFLHDLKVFLRERSLDGVDIDWEFVVEEDSAAIRVLVEEMRDSLGPSPSISAAVPASNYWARWFRAERFIDKMDWLGVMTYDMTGSWAESATFNAPLFPSSAAPDLSLSQAMQYWSSSRGIAKSKLLAGHPFYGYQFAAASAPGATDFGTVTYLDFREIATQQSTWTLHWDDEAQVPWATTSDGSYVTWNDDRATALAARYVRDNHYAGSIIWDLSADYDPGSGKHLLLDSVGAILLPTSTPILPQSAPQAMPPFSEPARLFGIDGKLWIGNRKGRAPHVSQPY